MHLPDGFVKQTRQSDRVSVRAVTSDDQVRVGNVALVVVGIEVDTVPARWEHKFGTNAIGAIGIDVVFGGQKVTVKRAFCSLTVVKAIETDSTLSQILLGGLAKSCPLRLGGVGLLVRVITDGVVAAVAVTSNHAESRRESRNGLVARRSRVEEVIATSHVSGRRMKETRNGFAH